MIFNYFATGRRLFVLGLALLATITSALGIYMYAYFRFVTEYAQANPLDLRGLTLVIAGGALPLSGVFLAVGRMLGGKDGVAAILKARNDNPGIRKGSNREAAGQDDGPEPGVRKPRRRSARRRFRS
ncbi:hypothetical protein [Micromonospora sp. NPDC048830]|uniref:hypothetical protein n=1 Tax=Micromonospora sp. NPDC048830 TaxID=3364257 RepID=UPI003722DCAA